MSNDPLDWILRADAIAEAERMNEPLTDDEEDDANFFLRLPSVDETNRVVSNNSCLLEEDKSSFKMSINVQQEAQLSSPYRFNTPPPRNRVVSNDSCLEEDKGSSKMSISVPQEAYNPPLALKLRHP
jgi:hypothetical protein